MTGGQHVTLPPASASHRRLSAPTPRADKCLPQTGESGESLSGVRPPSADGTADDHDRPASQWHPASRVNRMDRLSAIRLHCRIRPYWIKRGCASLRRDALAASRSGLRPRARARRPSSDQPALLWWLIPLSRSSGVGRNPSRALRVAFVDGLPPTERGRESPGSAAVGDDAGLGWPPAAFPGVNQGTPVPCSGSIRQSPG
jgi:hypothetical protein